MAMRLRHIRGGITVLLLISACGIWATVVLPSATKDDTLLQVTFLDVGQGDAIFIETPDSVQLLIDGGVDSAVLRQLANELSFFDRSLDVVLATHPDADHVGGLDDVLARYHVDTIIESGNVGESPAAAAFLAAAAAENAAVHEARAGDVIQLGASTTLTIFSPSYRVADVASNSASIVALLQFGEARFLLTGDAPSEIEDYLVATYGDELKADVLKLGHHGSDTSTSKLFLETVDPLFAIVSAGKDNRYGHPDPDVVERVDESGAALWSTIDSGSITFLSDGTKVWIER